MCTEPCINELNCDCSSVAVVARNTISALEQCELCFVSEEDFLQHIVIKLRKSCISSKEKNLKKFLNAVTDGSKLQCIIDVSLPLAFFMIPVVR